MEKCYEYFACERTGCIMFGGDGEPHCWDVQGTLCNHSSVELVEQRGMYKCKYCLYYNTVNRLT